jgi:D-sedoheptulose 7-phosphate isomerase
MLSNLEFFENYISKLQNILEKDFFDKIMDLSVNLQNVWREDKRVFLCGNGGSAANAIHLANDLLFGVSKEDGIGLKASALSANQAVMTCLANDISYHNIFSHQLKVQGEDGDILIVLSGSGNSPNIVEVLKQAKIMGIKSYAILGYLGGECLQLADSPIHFEIEDMQISEDLQLIVGHMVMQWLRNNPITPILSK